MELHSPYLWTRRAIPPEVILRREGAYQRSRLREKGLYDPRLEKGLDQVLAPTYGDGNLTATSSSASTRVTSSKTVPANAVVLGFMKWEDDTRTPTLSGWGVSSWTYPQHVNTGGPRLRVGVGVSSGTTGTLTADWGSATGWVKLGAIWLNGCDTVTPVDTSGQGTGSSATPAVSALTNSVADSVYVLGTSLYGDSGHSAWSFGGTGGTEALDDSSSSGVGYLIVSSAASRNGQCTVGSVDWATAMVIIKGGSSGITATLAATTPAFTVSFAGEAAIAANWAATFGGMDADLVSEVAIDAQLNATIPAYLASFVASSSSEIVAELAATVPGYTASFESAVEVQATLLALIPALTAALQAQTAIDAALQAQIPAPTTNLAATAAIDAQLQAAIPVFIVMLRQEGGGSRNFAMIRRLRMLMHQIVENE